VVSKNYHLQNNRLQNTIITSAVSKNHHLHNNCPITSEILLLPLLYLKIITSKTIISRTGDDF